MCLYLIQYKKKNILTKLFYYLSCFVDKYLKKLFFSHFTLLILLFIFILHMYIKIILLFYSFFFKFICPKNKIYFYTIFLVFNFVIFIN